MVSPDCTEHSFAEAQRIGTAVGEAVVKALGEAEGPLRPELAFASQTVKIGVENKRFLQALQAGLLAAYRGWAGTQLTADVAVMWLGPSVWMTMPGEPLPTLGLQAKALSDAPYKFFISLANGELGYLLPEKLWGEHKYEYEQSMSVGPQAAGLLLEALRTLLARTPSWAKAQPAQKAEGEEVVEEEAVGGAGTPAAPSEAVHVPTTASESQGLVGRASSQAAASQQALNPLPLEPRPSAPPEQ
jgi:hypothetical protein